MNGDKLPKSITIDVAYWESVRGIFVILDEDYMRQQLEEKIKELKNLITKED